MVEYFCDMSVSSYIVRYARRDCVDLDALRSMCMAFQPEQIGTISCINSIASIVREMWPAHNAVVTRFLLDLYICPTIIRQHGPIGHSMCEIVKYMIKIGVHISSIGPSSVGGHITGSQPFILLPKHIINNDVELVEYL